MKKKNKKAFIVSIIVVVILIVLYNLGLFGKIDLPFAIASNDPTSSGNPIVNPSTGTFDFITSNDSFKCDADECIVYGKMNIDYPLGSSVFICSTCPNPVIFNTLLDCQNTATRCNDRLNTCAKQYCTAKQTPYYQAYWNIRVSSDANYPFTTASTTKYNTSQVGLEAHPSAKIPRNAIITFLPMSVDNVTRITAKSLIINKYDLGIGCNPYLISPTNPNGQACKVGQKKCNPQPKCPQYYKLATNVDCQYLDGNVVNG